jgi:hypothetical protein
MTTGDETNAAEVQVAEGQWVVHARVSTHRASHPLDKRLGINAKGNQDARLRPMTQVVTRFVRVIGAHKDEVMAHVINDRVSREFHSWSNNVEFVLVSAKPFAVVSIADDEEYPSQSGYRRESVRIARQVHKGQLSKTFCPATLESTGSSFRTDSQEIRYVLLADVARQVGMGPMEVLRYFAQVSPSSWYEANAAVYAAHADGTIHDGKLCRFRVYTDAVPRGGDCGGAIGWGGEEAMSWRAFADKSWSDIRIPQRWARDILVLAHFGFIPGVCEVPEMSFDLRADCPEPYEVPGMLPPRPIDEIRELRGERGTEIQRGTFEKHVLVVTGQKAWVEMPILNDVGDFRYYTGYKGFRLFDGRLTVATSFWTRGGHGPGEHWAGLIAVHGQRASDPRRDQALYQLMIWPGQILRKTPEGALGGFFPEIEGVEPEIMTMIRALMEPWGFAEVRVE